MKGIILVGLVLAVAGCTTTEPLAVIAAGGEVMKGTTVAALTGGTFSASDSRATCSGTYDDLTMVQTVSFAVTCTDGRRGIGRAVRDSATGGSGTIQMSDGTTAKFVFGPSAANF